VEGSVGRFPWGYVLIAFGLGILASSLILYAASQPASEPSKTAPQQRLIRAE
jgi:hypothetical protein